MKLKISKKYQNFLI